jgi:hypothetical protein
MADIASLLDLHTRARRNALASLRAMHVRRAEVEEAEDAVAAAAEPSAPEAPGPEAGGDQLPSRRKGDAASSS